MKRAHAAIAVVAAGIAGCPARENVRPVGVTVPAKMVAEATLRRIGAGERAPLSGYRVEAKEGDWMLASDESVAVVSAKTGRLLDFGARGGSDEIVAIEPLLEVEIEKTGLPVQGKRAKIELDAIEPHDASLTVRWRVVDARAAISVTYALEGRALRMETLVTSLGDAVAAASIGESIAWGNVPTWVEGHGAIGDAGVFEGEHVGRDALGVAYAIAPAARVRFDPPSPGFWAWPRTSEDVGAIAAGGMSKHRVAWLAYGRSVGDAAVAVAAIAQGRAVDDVERIDLARLFEARGAESTGAPAYDVIVRRCDGRAFAPFRVSRAAPTIALPRGCFEAGLSAPGRAPSAWMPPRALADARLPAGTLSLVAVNPPHGAIPARFVVRGIAPTPDPSWGDDPIAGAALNVVYAKRDVDVPLPPGRYLVTASRGFEYTSSAREVTIEDGKPSALAFRLERVVDTRGWITADLHVHAIPSPDAPTRLSDRVRSLAAAGVEVAVATDHNAVTDYAPTIREEALSGSLTSIVGDEITTRGTLFGHFNVFPLAPSAAPVPYESTTPHALASAARATPPADRDKILQINHPRMGDIGYFDITRFDPKDVAAWRATPSAEIGFDAIEVFNGDHYARIDEVEKCMRDWYALLDAGVRMTATGNSDSHKIAYHEAGVPWNYVQIANDDPEKLDERAFVEAVRRGRVVVSSGPFVRIAAGDRGIGDTITPGEIALSVRVDAPPWVDVDRVEIVGRSGAVLRVWNVAPTAAVTRLDERVKLRLAKGDWVIAVARGTKPMTLLHRAGATPLAFTNPIFVD
jgi:hypothetical protein